MHAWYSRLQEHSVGYVVWCTTDGQRVKATDVSWSKDNKGNKWPDLEYMGEVESFVSNHQIDYRKGVK
jgi:hypothetical protein